MLELPQTKPTNNTSILLSDIGVNSMVVICSAAAVAADASIVVVVVVVRQIQTTESAEHL